VVLNGTRCLNTLLGRLSTQEVGSTTIDSGYHSWFMRGSGESSQSALNKYTSELDTTLSIRFIWVISLIKCSTSTVPSDLVRKLKKEKRKNKIKWKNYSQGKKVPITSFLRRSRTPYGEEA
jgi:hypothetical protein